MKAKQSITVKKIVSIETFKKRAYWLKRKNEKLKKRSESTQLPSIRMKMSSDQRESDKNKESDSRCQRRAHLSCAEREHIKQHESATRAKRWKVTGYNKENASGSNPDIQPDDNTIHKCKMEALKILHPTMLADKAGWHKYPVCVICDCFIIGTAKVKK